MKTTLVLDDHVTQLLEQEAIRSGRTISELVEVAVLRWLEPPSRSKRQPSPLPTFNSGGHLVDIANRDELYGAMDGR